MTQDKICPECGKDLEATNSDPIKHAIRHWGDIDEALKSDKTSPEVRKRITILKEMA